MDEQLTIEDVEALIAQELPFAGDEAHRAAYLLGLSLGIARRHRAERDRLREAPGDGLRKSTQAQFVDLEDERDRLRAVVRRAQEAWISYTENLDDDDASNEWSVAWDALRALDVSGQATDG